VDEDVVSSLKVMQLLKQFGLDAKDPVPLDGARVLGLRVTSEGCKLVLRRDNQVDNVDEVKTRRQVFSWCGQLVGHFPVAKWLRPACSYIKRSTNGTNWDEAISESVTKMVMETHKKVSQCDPVRGVWRVSGGNRGAVWCDASSLALGAVLEIDGSVVEDGCWLRKADDSAHINLAELEAVIKGVNMAVAWGLRDLTIYTDSSTGYGWLTSLCTGDRRIKTYGLGAVLARRRLSLIGHIVKECDLQVTLRLIKKRRTRLTR
jgi:hypothetical protein